MNAGTTSRALAALVMILLLQPLGAARAEGDAPAAAPAPPAAAPAPATNGSASASPVSATGLLPIFGVGVEFDSEKAKPEEAVASMQKLWDGYLKAAGFNVIQFPVDVKELGDKGAGRLAKLCAWAKTNNVRLAPILMSGEAGDPLSGDYPDKVGAFAAKTIELVGKGGDAQAYSQIMFYQLERPLNHPASHGPMEASEAAEVFRKTIEKLHAAEQGGLAGTSLQATPVLASVSFDYELIRFGAIVNVPITDESYQQAYESLRGYLTTVMNAAPVDVVGLEWFPGSVSSDAMDRFPDVIAKLQGDFPGKLLLVGTGYSTAAGGESEQSRYYTQTFNNLSDLRANQGVESSFAGILWRTAMDRTEGEPSPPSSKTLAEMAKWNWSERATEVTRMWNEPGADSKEMRWWLGRVESHFGLMGAGKDISKPGKPKLSYQLLSRLTTSLAAAAEATGAGEIAKELSSAGSAKGVAGMVKDKLQAALFGMLDVWIAKTAENLVSGGTSSGGGDGGGGGGGGGGSSYTPPPPPAPANLADLVINTAGPAVTPTPEMKVGTAFPISVTLMNSGTAPATNVVVSLREGTSADLGNTAPTTISPGSTTTLTVPWTPARPGNYKDVAVDAYCDNEGDLSTNKMLFEDFVVAPAPSGGGGGGGRGGMGGGILVSPGSLGTVKGVMTTRTDPGFIRIESVRSMPVMTVMSGPGAGRGGAVPMMATGGSGGGTAGGAGSGAPQAYSGSGGSGVHVLGSGATTSGGGTGGSATGGTASTSYSMTAASSGPQPISLAFTVTNPFDHNFTSVKGTLKVDNKVVATKDLGVLFPRQRRTVTFAQWTPTKAGTFPVRIELAGLGPGSRPLSGTAMDQITVTPAMMKPGGASPGGATGVKVAGTSTRSVLVGGGTGAAMTASGGAAPVTRTRLMTPMILAPAPAPAPAGGTQTRQVLGGTVAVRSMITASILGLTANSIVLTPFPAQAGNDVTLSVRLFNSERLPADKVKIEAFVDADKLGETTVDVPAGRTVVASGFRSWTAKPGRHDVRTVATWGSRSGSATKPIDIRPPLAIGAGGVAALVGRASMTPVAMTPAGSMTPVAMRPVALTGLTLAATRLVITATDVRLNPIAPAAGTPVELSVHVQNPGTADAKAVRAELFADGVRLGEATGDVPAGRDFVFTGFPRWTPAAGRHVLLCRATAPGQITEATREITVGAAMIMAKPLVAATTTATLATPMGMAGMTMREAIVVRPDLQVLPTDFTFAPATPRAGDPLTVTIVVRNIGTGPANGGTVTGILQVDGAEAARREFPVTIAAKGMTTLVWPITTPAGKAITVVATATVANDSRADNNEARASTSVAPRVIDRQLLLIPR